MSPAVKFDSIGRDIIFSLAAFKVTVMIKALFHTKYNGKVNNFFNSDIEEINLLL